MDSAYRPIETYSPIVTPPRDHLMAILRAYIDDSNHPKSPGHSALVFAGFVADLDQWKKFETLWQSALDQAHVPYFHLKEFGKKDGIYKHLKENSELEIKFISNLIEAISKTVQFCVSSAILLEDLRAFNKQHGLNLNEHAMAVYGSIVDLRLRFHTENIEIVFDKFDKSVSRIAMGMDYARTDVEGNFRVDGLTPKPLKNTESFKTVLPLQAADFIAGELRKYLQDRRGWQLPKVNQRGQRQVELSYFQWWGEYFLENNKPPIERGSYVALLEALKKSEGSGPVGYIWDTHLFEQALSRHPNGWVDSA